MSKLKTYENIFLLNKIDDLLSDDNTVNRLIHIEKERRKVSSDALVFLGMKNVSDYHWCAMKSYYDSKDDELLFFKIYLKDRLRYSVLLSLIDAIPNNDVQLLTTGQEITFDQVVSLAPVVSESFSNKFITDYDTETPMDRGVRLHQENNASKKSVRWNFQWQKFVLIGVPDGIDDDKIYEFKTCGSSYLFKFAKWPAIAQANLYGLFYGLSKKEIEFKIMDKDETIFIREKVKKRDAKETLKNFTLVCSGYIPSAPISWKCKPCKHLHYCLVKLQAQNV